MRRPTYVSAVLALPLAAALVACVDDAPPHTVALTTTLVQYPSCGALESDLEDALIAELDAMLEQATSPNFGWDDAEPQAGGDSGGGREEGVDFSGTNNQEDGVDEADLVKTDGFHIYALNGNRLHIFGVPTFGELEPEGVISIEGHPSEMLLDTDADRAVVFSMIYPGQLPEEHPLRDLVGHPLADGTWAWRTSTLTKITVLDVADRSAPELVREVYFEGQYQTARKVDRSVRMSAYSWFDHSVLWDWWSVYAETGEDLEATRAILHARIRALDLADFVPQLYVRTPEGAFASNSLTTESCASFYRPTDSGARGVSTIISFELLGPAVSWDADHVVSNWATFYQSEDRLVLAEAAHAWWWYWTWADDPEQLNVHSFDVSTPGETRYVGSGRVEGYLVDQFAIDEQDGYLRLATTTNLWGNWWDETPEEPESHVWVLDGRGPALAQVGHVGGIAPGEQLMSARLLADRGYLVTFEQTDPLFTLDLRDPTDPRVVGELEVPGFSTYLHPLDEETLLSIGVGGDETGANWETTVSLFDVAQPAQPERTDHLSLALEGGWGWSEALWEHKAFQYWAPKHLLAVPQSTYAYEVDDEGNYTYDYLSRLEVVSVDAEAGLAHHGTIDHSAYYSADPEAWWSYVDIRRSIFMGDYLYAISDKAITVHTTDDLALVTDAELPGYTEADVYWWW